MTTGELVKWLCEEQGFTRRALAEKAGIAEATVWRIIHDTGKVKVKTLKKIAKALGVSVDYIQEEDREPDGISAEEKICLAYERKGIALREITAQTGLSGETVIKAKQDIFSVEHESLCRLAKFLGLDAQELYDSELERIRNAPLPEKIKMLCRRKGITQKEFNRLIGMDESGFRYILNGKRYLISVKTYTRWAEVLDVPVDIFCSEEDMVQEALMQETMAKRLGTLCEVRGISLRELAKLSGVGYTTLSDIKRGYNIAPKESTLMKIVGALNVSFDELVYGI